MQSSEHSKEVEAFQSSPLKVLSQLAIRVRRSSIPSPIKLKPSKSGNICIENPGFFKSNFEYELSCMNQTLVIPYTQENNISLCVDDFKMCRICLTSENSGTLINPCACTGSQKFVHEECLKTWLLTKKKDDLNQCELCKENFKMTFEVTSACMPFHNLNTCKAWIPCIICLALLGGIIYICYLAFANETSDVAVTVGAFVLGILWISCCVQSVFATSRVCFTRKVESWTISNGANIE